ncbi:hypothetical protein GCM10027299_12320 [Larkinella ripae]
MATLTTPAGRSSGLVFTHLPGFAKFLLEQHLAEFSQELLRLFQEVDIPMLAFFKTLPPEQLAQIAKDSAVVLLTSFAENRADGHMDATLQRWVQDQLQGLDRNQIATRDIALMGYVRKQAMLTFLAHYTTNPAELIGLVREMDRYTMELASRAFEIYISILHEKIDEQFHFNEKLTDTSPGVIYVFDLIDRKELFTNRKVEPMLGYTPEEIHDMGDLYLQTVHHPDDIPQILAHLDSFVTTKDGEVRTFEHRLKDKTGRFRWMRNYESVFRRQPDGKPWQIIGLALDIELEKQSVLLADEKKRQLEQSNASLQEFAYIASHDLKEPLRKITTFGERLLISQQEKIDASGKLYLSKIMDAAQRMHTLIDDVLSVSLISANQRFENQSLHLILNDVLQSLEHKIEQVKAEVHAENLPAAPVVASQFRQLFQNLLTNAFKFSRKDIPPVIRITHRFLAPDENRPPGLTAGRPYLELKIADNGIGFDNRYASKIFAIFQRLHVRKEFEGTGIGLAICKKIVENHGGVITASGFPNQGATFTIVIPA